MNQSVSVRSSVLESLHASLSPRKELRLSAEQKLQVLEVTEGESINVTVNCQITQSRFKSNVVCIVLAVVVLVVVVVVAVLVVVVLVMVVLLSTAASAVLIYYCPLYCNSP